MFSLKDFDYYLPKNLIAIKPQKPRDHSRLLVLKKRTGHIDHTYFYNLANYLQAGDVLVLNNSKVWPARLIGRKQATGGKIEVFLLHNLGAWHWQCLLGGPRRRLGIKIEFSRGLFGFIEKRNQDGTWLIKFNKSKKEVIKIASQIGLTPLPPYIKRPVAKTDSKNYQTIYADDRKLGSVAAPTAGFHFTNRLLKKIKSKGGQIEFITLHVGLGTFAPVKVNNIIKHKMHAERIELNTAVIRRILKAKEKGKRIIAVGTTSARALESLPPLSELKNKKQFTGWIDIFIYPPYQFKIVDGLITNFHLPKSTLLMLVTALAGKKNIDKAYQEAIKRQYRFYSYGDAMFII